MSDFIEKTKPTREEMIQNFLDSLENNTNVDSMFSVDEKLPPGIIKFTDENGFVLILNCKIENDELIFTDYFVE